MGYICRNGEDLEVCMITGSRMGADRGGGERQQGHMKEKMKSDLVDPGNLWIERGARGTAKSKCGHS